MDVWGPARIHGQGRERYFLLVVDAYSRYTTVFPLRSKGEVTEVLIDWIRAARLQLRERFGSDFPVLRLHSDRGREFSSDLLRAFCRAEGIRQTFTLPASPQQNGIAERRIGMVMDFARTSMIHAATPHYLWPFAVQYAAHQINLQPQVSLPETSPTMRWTGKVGDASAFRFYHPTSRRVLSSQDVTFDESVPYYRLFPYRTAPLPPPPLFLAPGPPLVDPLPLQAGGAASTGGSAATGGAGAGGSTGAGPGVSTSAGGAGAAGPGGSRTGGLGAAGPAGAPSAGAGGAAGVGATGGTGAGAAVSAGGPAGARAAGGTGAGGAVGVRADAGGDGVVPAGSRRAARPRPYFVPLLEQVLGLPPSSGPAPSLECPPPVQSESQLQLASPLPAPSPYAGHTGSIAERREPESRPASPVRTACTSRRVPRPLPPAVPGTHQMTLCPSTAPQRVPLPSPPASSLPALADPAADSLHSASPTVTRLLATVVTDPSFESTAASALVTELVDFAAHCRLDFATSLVAESASVCPPSVGGECALSTDVLKDRREEFQCFAAALPHLVSTLLSPEGDPDAPDIPTPRSYAEAIEGPYSSQWQAAMDAEMASWKSTGTYVDEVPPPGPNIVSGMWIFRVKRPPGSPLVFKARYAARGFSQRQGVDYFQTFSPTPKMTTLRVLLHVAAQRDYELYSLDFSTAFLQGSLHEEIWLRRPPGFTGSFPPGTQWSLRRPVYILRQAAREWHDTLRTTLAALGFAPSTADPSLFLRTDTSLPPFYILVYVDDLVFATADIAGLAHVKSELQKRHTCTDLGELRSYLGLQFTRDRARHTITLTQSHMVLKVLQRFDFTYSSPQATPLSTRHSLSALPSDESVEPSGPYPELVGCLMYLMTCTRPDLEYPLSILARYVAPGRHQPEHMASAKRVLRYLCRAMAAQELRWLTYLLTDLGEPPRSPPVLYVDNKAMLALCREHKLEHRTKHIALRYFLARELQQRGQLRLAYVASQANTADIFTKALQPCDHQRFCTLLVMGASGEEKDEEKGGKSEERKAGFFFFVNKGATDLAMAAKVLLHPLTHWVIDSGSSWHMTPRADLLDEIQPAPISTVTSATGAKAKVMGMGCAKFMGVDGELVGLKNVLWVPDLCANLISTGRLGDAGVNTETIGSERYRTYNDERLIWDLQWKGDVHKRMWQIPVLPWRKSGKAAAAASMEESVTEEEQQGVQGEELIGGSAAVKTSATSGQADWETWHRRLAHVAVSTSEVMQKEKCVHGLQLQRDGAHYGSCESCMQNKFARFPFPRAEGSAKAPLEVVHMDLVGPMRTEGTGGELYFLTMVDEWSRFTWAHPLSKKSDAAAAIKEDWLPMVERQAMRLVKVLRIDRGGEFLGAEVTKFLKKNGIRHQLTCPGTLQQNGIAERANRTISEAAKTLLGAAGMPRSSGLKLFAMSSRLRTGS
ncbi:unnamed protein product [Closterium sp. NIES-54]